MKCKKYFKSAQVLQTVLTLFSRRLVVPACQARDSEDRAVSRGRLGLLPGTARYCLGGRLVGQKGTITHLLRNCMTNSGDDWGPDAVGWETIGETPLWSIWPEAHQSRNHKAKQTKGESPQWSPASAPNGSLPQPRSCTFAPDGLPSSAPDGFSDCDKLAQIGGWGVRRLRSRPMTCPCEKALPASSRRRTPHPPIWADRLKTQSD